MGVGGADPIPAPSVNMILILKVNQMFLKCLHDNTIKIFSR